MQLYLIVDNLLLTLLSILALLTLHTKLQAAEKANSVVHSVPFLTEYLFIKLSCTFF